MARTARVGRGEIFEMTHDEFKSKFDEVLQNGFASDDAPPYEMPMVAGAIWKPVFAKGADGFQDCMHWDGHWAVNGAFIGRVRPKYVPRKSRGFKIVNYKWRACIGNGEWGRPRFNSFQDAARHVAECAAPILDLGSHDATVPVQNAK